MKPFFPLCGSGLSLGCTLPPSTVWPDGGSHADPRHWIRPTIQPAVRLGAAHPAHWGKGLNTIALSNLVILVGVRNSLRDFLNLCEICNARSWLHFLPVYEDELSVLKMIEISVRRVWLINQVQVQIVPFHENVNHCRSWVEVILQ